MSLDSSLFIASSGLANINRQINVVSQNVANASTPDYAREIGTQTDLSAQGQGFGVFHGPTVREIDLQLQAQVFSQNATVSALQTSQATLQPIDAVQGTPGAGNDLSSLLGKLQDSFTTLQLDPSSASGQRQVVTAGSNLAQKINALSASYATARQTAETNIENGVGTINTAIANISDLTVKIIAGQQTGQSTADLENQRDTAMHTVSNLIDVRFIGQANGGLLAATPGGLAVSLSNPPPQFAIVPSSPGAASYYPNGGIQPVTLAGQDVTRTLTGGSLGASIILRDTTLPTYQAELDEFANTLSNRFSAQGLALFNTQAGSSSVIVPPPVQTAYIGYASTIAINPAVVTNPTQVRDGNLSILGSSTGASAFTPNPPLGPASFTGLVTRLLTNTFGSELQAGVPQTAPATTGLGPLGNLQSPFVAPADLAGFATAVVAAQSGDIAGINDQVQTESAVQSALQARITSGSGVSTDSELSHMVELQNAYGANARVIAAVQAMWTQLLTAVP